jgi:3'-phosphoadenosine 5'-phosphosulfate sulfotransferase (PAPS reductase)/FAD synthetase
MDINELKELTGSNSTIFDSVCKAHSVICRHNNIACSISGGKDSDIVLDLITKIDTFHKVRYIWFDTGMEYNATKLHLDYLEKKYGITIERIKAIKSIPTCCKEYGQPFLSKFISQMIEALQKVDFQWKDEPYEVLIQKYPGKSSYLKWWCNLNKYKSYNIERKLFLKEFLIANPPTFKISNKCCKYAKKLVAIQFDKENNIDLHINGVRKYEGGVRAGIDTCFTFGKKNADRYRPLFWYKVSDESEYEMIFNISHSDCYTKWGMKRTGCVGCPYNIYLENDLKLIAQYEPKMLNACNHIFGDSYNYTKLYREFVKQMKAERKECS